MNKALPILCGLFMAGGFASCADDGASIALGEVLTATKMELLWTVKKDEDICTGESIPDVWLIQYPCVRTGDGPRAVVREALGGKGAHGLKLRTTHTLVGAFESHGFYCLIYGSTERILRCEYNRFTIASHPAGGLILLDIYDREWNLVGSSLQN